MRIPFTNSPTSRLIALALVAVSVSVINLGAAPPSPDNDRDVASGLLVTQDRQLDQSLESAQKCVEAGDFGAAAVLLQQIITAEDSFTANSANSTYFSTRELAWQLASQLPVEPRGRFEHAVDQVARERWLIIQQRSSPEAIAEFVRRFRQTLSGFEALHFLAATYRDSGRPEQAAIAWRSVASHPRATATQTTVATVASIECLIAAGQLDAADQARRSLHRDTENQSVVIAGSAVSVEDWIAKRLSASRKAEPFHRSATGSLLPSMESVWSRDTNPVTELQQTLSLIQRYYREQGVVSSSAIRPVVSGTIVLTRTMQELQAFDLNSGELIWSVPNHEYQQSGGFRSSQAAAWHRRSEADSVFSGIATDGKLVVVVQEPPNLDFSRSATGPLPGSDAQPRKGAARPVQAVHWNRLCGYEIASGQLRWQVGGPPTGPADLFGGISFLGTPLFVDDLLFVMARHDDELSLLAMDHGTGHLRWSVKLGTLAPHLAESISRRRVACPVTLANGLLLCPTASGLLAAVNPTTRAMEWAFRYPVIQHDLPVRPVNGSSTAVLPDVWWNEWREVSSSITGGTVDQPGCVVFASPDSNQLHAIHLSDGASFWSIPRGEAMYLGGTTQDSVVLIEPMAIRAHDLKTGRMRWRTETGEICGRGSIVGPQFFQPRRGGGVAVVNLADGSPLHGLTAANAICGALIPCENGWLTQTETALMRLPLLKAVRQRAESRLKDQPDEFNTLEVAKLEYQSGDLQAAQQRLAGMTSVEARSLRRDAIRADLQTRSMAAADRESLGRDLLALCDTDDERLAARMALGDSAWKGREPIAAMTHLLDGLELVDAIGLRHVGYWPGADGSTRSIRADRVLLGTIQRILDDARRQSDSGSDSRLSSDLEQVLASRLAMAQNSKDPFAAQQWIDRLLPLDWARRALLAHPKEALYARPQYKVELELLSASGSRDPSIAVRSLAQLSETLAVSGRSESEAIQRRILAEYPQTPLGNGLSLAASLQSKPELADLRHRLLDAPPETWPPGLPNVERESRPRDHHLHQIPVQIQGEPDSLLARLDVAIDRGGREIRFSADGHSGIWKSELPGAPNTFRVQFAQIDQVEAYGVGRLLIVRIGSEVFGVMPFNERGEPHAKTTSLQFDMVSSRSEMPGETWWNVEPVPARVGIRHEGTRLVDGFGRTLGGLGPVRAGYLCYRSQARLVAIDIQTGRRLWNRIDLPTNCQVFGDDDYVYLWRTDSQWLQTLSAIDGRVVEERVWNLGVEDILCHHGSYVWSIEDGASTSVAMTDLRTGSIAWRRSFAADSIPFSMDESTIGVLESPGTMHILSASTGATRGQPITVALPAKVERIVCLHDAHRWYVAISGPVPRLPVLLGEQTWGGLRMAFVNGLLYGIDRHSASITWQRQLDSEPLSLTQSCVAPVIVQMWRQSEGGGPGNSLCILRLLDTRTGQEIVTHRAPSLQPYYQLFPSEHRDRYDIRIEQDMFRLTFNSRSGQPGPAPR
ncbi:MAG: PQQ-binding-like beta-propeller repeat protein [Planctomycetes bacterium]|nr:PQQ-binding-like beta-propeller repeat protein [Planctomycetota bacterium]